MDASSIFERLLEKAGKDNGDIITAPPQVYLGKNSWLRDHEHDEPIGMEDLTEIVSTHKVHTMVFGILRSLLAMISIISSATLVWMLRRSHVGFTTTYHRLLLGICVGDLMLSLGNSFFNMASPAENSYIIWNARGNMATCNTVGFLNDFGLVLSLMYTCNLNLYSLAVVKYEKSEEYINKNIEPKMHANAVVSAFIFGLTILLSENFNDDLAGSCLSPSNEAPHCIGYANGQTRDGFEIPCGRGSSRKMVFVILYAVGSSLPPVVIGTCLFLIYRVVTESEKKLSRYGIGALRSNIASANYLEESETGESVRGISNVLRNTFSIRKLFPKQPSHRGSNTTRSQSRAVMQKAIAYSTVYMFTYLFMSIFAYQGFVANKTVPLSITYLLIFFSIPQGFYNLSIFLYPKVLQLKRKDNLNWRQAIKNAFWSKGNHGTKNRGACRPKTEKKRRIKSRLRNKSGKSSREDSKVNLSSDDRIGEDSKVNSSGDLSSLHQPPSTFASLRGTLPKDCIKFHCNNVKPQDYFINQDNGANKKNRDSSEAKNNLSPGHSVSWLPHANDNNKSSTVFGEGGEKHVSNNATDQRKTHTSKEVSRDSMKNQDNRVKKSSLVSPGAGDNLRSSLSFLPYLRAKDSNRSSTLLCKAGDKPMSNNTLQKRSNHIDEDYVCNDPLMNQDDGAIYKNHGSPTGRDNLNLGSSFLSSLGESGNRDFFLASTITNGVEKRNNPIDVNDSSINHQLGALDERCGLPAVIKKRVEPLSAFGEIGDSNTTSITHNESNTVDLESAKCFLEEFDSGGIYVADECMENDGNQEKKLHESLLLRASYHFEGN